MDLLDRPSIRHEFRRRTALSRELQDRLAEDIRRREREEREERQQEAETSDFLQAAVLATETQIAEFTLTLDRYDAATVEALLENEKQLVAVQARIDDMLLRAHVLPDGRRVFKTEDGLRVFDEFGVELQPEEIEPASIDDARPRWERFQDAQADQTQLQQQREDLTDYQQRLDDARDRLDDPTLTQDDLNALDESLSEEMPDAVRQTLDLPPKAEEPAAEGEPAADATQSNSPSNHIQGAPQIQPPL